MLRNNIITLNGLYYRVLNTENYPINSYSFSNSALIIKYKDQELNVLYTVIFTLFYGSNKFKAKKWYIRGMQDNEIFGLSFPDNLKILELELVG